MAQNYALFYNEQYELKKNFLNWQLYYTFLNDLLKIKRHLQHFYNTRQLSVVVMVANRL